MGGIVCFLFTIGFFLESIQHRIRLLKKPFLFQDEPETFFILVAIHLLSFMCNAVFSNTFSQTQLVSDRSGIGKAAMTQIQTPLVIIWKVLQCKNFNSIFFPSSHPNFETRDRKGSCGTHLCSAQPNPNEMFKETFRKESKSYRKKKLKLPLLVTLRKYKASVN